MFRWLSLWIVSAGLSACSATSVHPETPAQTVQVFLQALERAAEKPEYLRTAYNLLSPQDQKALGARANLATALSRHEYKAWDMLAYEHFNLGFAWPARKGLEERIQGTKAWVRLKGPNASQEVVVTLQRVQQEWRLVLNIPPPSNTTS